MFLSCVRMRAYIVCVCVCMHVDVKGKPLEWSRSRRNGCIVQVKV